MNDLFTPIMTTAEKMQMCRQLLGATQGEIAKNICTRSHVGAVESGAVLTPDKARKFASRINELASLRHVNLHVAPEFLLETVEVQAARYINKTLDILNENKDAVLFEKELVKLENIIAAYEGNISDTLKYEVYKLAYEKYFEHIKYYECENYVIKCFVIANKIKKDPTELILMFTRIYGFTHKYEGIITWGKEFINSTLDTQEIRLINWNVAKAYKRTKQIDHCIKHLSEMQKKFTWTYSENLRNRMLYAECLKERNKLKAALNIYLQLVRESKENNSEYYTELFHVNLAEINLTLGNYKSALIFIKKALQPKTQLYGYESEIQQSIYYDAFKTYLLLDKFQEAEVYFIKTVTEPGNNNDEKLILRAVREMISYCMKKGKDSLLTKIPQIVTDAVIIEVIKYPDVVLSLYEIVDYYKDSNSDLYLKVYEDVFNITKIFTKK